MTTTVTGSAASMEALEKYVAPLFDAIGSDADTSAAHDAQK